MMYIYIYQPSVSKKKKICNLVLFLSRLYVPQCVHDETNQIIVGGFNHNFSFNDFSTNYIVGVT